MRGLTDRACDGVCEWYRMAGGGLCWCVKNRKGKTRFGLLDGLVSVMGRKKRRRQMRRRPQSPGQPEPTLNSSTSCGRCEGRVAAGRCATE